MKARLKYAASAPATIEALSRLSSHSDTEFADHKLKVLVELRVSQINGCAYCVDLHSHQARELGEKQQRLDCLLVWREVDFFDARERAAFAWAEAVTLIAQSRVSDELFAEVAGQFTEQELVQLTVIIGLMNVWNRISISFRNAPAERRSIP